jgi:heat shock protein HslJ
MSKRILGPRLAALASLCTLVAVAGCSAISGASAGASAVSSTAASAQSAALTGTSWQLTELAGQPGARQTLQFDASQGRVSGNGGCNNFSGGYQWSGKSLKMGPLASTRRACVDDATSRQESAFLKALEDTRTWQVDGKVLILAGDSGPLARFTAQ